MSEPALAIPTAVELLLSSVDVETVDRLAVESSPDSGDRDMPGAGDIVGSTLPAAGTTVASWASAAATGLSAAACCAERAPGPAVHGLGRPAPTASSGRSFVQGRRPTHHLEQERVDFLDLSQVRDVGLDGGAEKARHGGGLERALKYLRAALRWRLRRVQRCRLDRETE